MAQAPMAQAPMAQAPLPSSAGFAAAPPITPAPRPAAPPWMWPAVLGGVLVVALIGVAIAATSGAPAPAATPLAVAVPQPVAIPLPVPPTTTQPTMPVPVVAPTPIGIAPLPAGPVDVVTAPVPAPAPTSLEPPATSDVPVVAHAPVHTGPGTIAISVSGGWADIYVDGELRGRTPRQLQVSSGRHDVELRPNGTGPGQHQTVNVRAGGTSRVTVRLGG
jgi:hypothetical protein